MSSLGELSSSQESSFEEAFSQLGEAVQRLESGGLTLEQATTFYEEGMRLASVCNQLLDSAQLKLTQLRNAYPELLEGSQEEE